MKKENGITLIALVITIIVLLILAGVSILLVVGDNGVLTQATNAVEKNREATAMEDVQMAWASATSEYWSDWANDSSKNLSEYLTMDMLNKYLIDKGEIIDEPTIDENIYMLDYYSNNQGIIYTLTIDGAGKTTITGSTTTDTKQYLADIAEIGDYVDIGIKYENKNGTVGNETTLTGWRVLSKNGSGESGNVYVVSAGVPLSYYEKNDGTTSINTIGNLFKDDLTFSETIHNGFYSNGLKNSSGKISNKLATEVFNKKLINTSSGIHAMTNNELKTAYNALGGTRLSYADYTTDDKFSNLGKASQLLHIGAHYWLGGETYNTSGSLWNVQSDGKYYCQDNMAIGIRPVISLKSGIIVLRGDGSNNSPYKLLSSK